MWPRDICPLSRPYCVNSCYRVKKSPGMEVESFKHYSKGLTLYSVWAFLCLLPACVLLHACTVAKGMLT